MKRGSMRHDPSGAFEYTTVPYGDDGKLTRGIIARCGACEAAVPLPVNHQSNSRGVDSTVEWQFIARKLELRGWSIGKSRTAHRCPKCQKLVKFAGYSAKPEGLDTSNLLHIRATTALASATVGSLNKEIVNDQKLNGETPMKAVENNANARTMSREDRRIIFDKLNQIYVDAKIGYGPGWTDERVATDLGVPRAWVRVIRDENFGDEVSNENIRAIVAEAKIALAQMRDIEPNMRRLMGLADKIERQLADIQKVFK